MEKADAGVVCDVCADDIGFIIGMMKQFMEELGEWLRHKNKGHSYEAIYKVANSRLGWYKKSGMNVVNFIISKDLPENRIKDGAGLLNPLSYSYSIAVLFGP